MSKPGKKNDVIDVAFEDAMDIAGYGKFSMFIICLSGLTLTTSTLGSVDVSFLLPAAECDLHLSSTDKGLLGSAFFIGTIAASHLSGFLADTLGRKYVLVRGLSLNVLFYILGTFAPNFWSFFTIKVISGALTSPTSIATIPLLGEFVPTKRRAQALLITTSLSTIGLLYSALIGWLTLQGTWALDLWIVTFTPWRLFFLLCAVPSLLCCILFCLVPESPKFVLTRGNREDTLKILQRVHSINTGRVPESYPVKSVIMDAHEVLPPPLAEGKGVLPVLKHICDQTLPLFRPPFLKDLMLCVILMVDICLCANTVFLWLPEITNRISVYQETHAADSTLCDMVRREHILTSDVTNTTSAPVECVSTINTAVFLPNVIIALVRPVIMLAASFIVPLFDRRLVLGSLLVFGSSVAFLITVVSDASIAIMILGALTMVAVLSHNVLCSIVIEIFPTYISAMAVSISNIFGRFGSVMGSQLFSFLIDTQCPLLFHLLSGTLLCCAVVPFFFKLQNKTPSPTTRARNTSISIP